MADYTIGLTDEGAYEIPLAAGVAKTIQITSGRYARDGVIVQQLSGASPVYARRGTTVTAQDPKSTMVVAGQWASVVNESGALTITISVISVAAAVISVYRDGDAK
jgi:hypothetical protein